MTRGDDDLPPTGDEAQAQRQQTVAPLIWGGFGLAVALAFAALLFVTNEAGGPKSAIVAPSGPPPSSGT
jgi:hypothetical protein